jgi:RNA polymerase sigma factor (sigma-70 family)
MLKLQFSPGSATIGFAGAPVSIGPSKRRKVLKLASVQEVMEEPGDAWLVSAVARRDASAFRMLVDCHAPALHRIAYRMLGDRSEAEDVAQECLVKLWDHAASWTAQGGGLPAWLRRVATNQCLDRLRRRARMSDAEPPERADDAPPADVLLDSRRLADVARRALQALPDRQRAAVVLTYYEQLNNAAAADALDMKLKAFESLLVRARAALRDHVHAAGISATDLGGGA